MLEDIKFDLQTIDYRALSASQWTELKNRLEHRARRERYHAINAMADDAYGALSRFVLTVKIWVGLWAGYLVSTLGREWRTYARAHRRRLAMNQFNALNHNRPKDIRLRR